MKKVMSLRKNVQVVDLSGNMHIAEEFMDKTSEAKLKCNKFNNSIYSRLYSWSRAFIPHKNCVIQPKRRCNICFGME